MINIISGIRKRIKIDVPQTSVRPTSAKKRESIFSIINSYENKKNFKVYKKLNVLDLFAGSGSLGLEAISRGANFVYFYENNIDTIKYLENNCLKICKNSNYQIIKKNILKNKFNDINKQISLVFIDPPYKINPFEEILINIYKSKILTKNALIVLECSIKTEIKLPSYFFCIKIRKYRKTKIFFLIS